MDWHTRFNQQVSWTAELRRYLFARTGQDSARRVLEIGCGTGALLSTLDVRQAVIFGLDINSAFLQQAAGNLPTARLTQGDAHNLPFAESQFDSVYFHFTLLWVNEPQSVLDEARRIVGSGGWVMALAEPDYGGRIDYPDTLAGLGQLQAEALRSQGADIKMGRRLGGLFHQTGLVNIETGVVSGRWMGAASQDEIDLEWQVLDADLTGRLSEHELSRLRQIDRQARESGERTLFVPTFYAIGQVK